MYVSVRDDEYLRLCVDSAQMKSTGGFVFDWLYYIKACI